MPPHGKASNPILGVPVTAEQALELADLQRFRLENERASYLSAWDEVGRVLDATPEAAKEWQYARDVVGAKVKALGLVDPPAIYAEVAINSAAVCFILRGGLTAVTGRWLMVPWRKVMRHAQ